MRQLIVQVNETRGGYEVSVKDEKGHEEYAVASTPRQAALRASELIKDCLLPTD